MPSMSSDGPIELAPLRIGRLLIDPPLLQAPMSALTNLPMRTLTEEQGCGLTVTEFLPAAGLAARSQKVLDKLRPSRGGRPFGVQIYGREPKLMRKAAALAVERGAALVDINMGCPAKKVTKGACGSALMREPPLAASLVRAVKQGVDGAAEVTVKMRAGWDAFNKNAPEFAERMVDAGAMAITVHGRTREQRYSGEVDLEIIAAVKERLSVPVIANGDIVDGPSLSRALRQTHADAAMIGRAALGNPWVFSRLGHHLKGLPEPPEPSAAQRIDTYRRHLGLYLEIADEWRAIIEMRKFAHWYLAPVEGGDNIRQQINRATTVDSVHEILSAAA